MLIMQSSFSFVFLFLKNFLLFPQTNPSHSHNGRIPCIPPSPGRAESGQMLTGYVPVSIPTDNKTWIDHWTQSLRVRRAVTLQPHGILFHDVTKINNNNSNNYNNNNIEN